jgi:F0F1-type ATP synthase delta subunit
MEHDTLAGLRVPSLITSPIDVARLRREVSALNEYLDQQKLRGADHSVAGLPKVSGLLDELAKTNKLNLLDAPTRQHLIAFLADLAAHAPVVHISFATDPPPNFLQKLITWLRQNIHSSLLVQVGLQPSIGAGCVVRTTNKYFDLSLRTSFAEHSADLIKELQGEVASAEA